MKILVSSIFVCCVIATTRATPFEPIAADAKKMMHDLKEIQKQLNAAEAEASELSDETKVLDPDAGLRRTMMKEFESEIQGKQPMIQNGKAELLKNALEFDSAPDLDHGGKPHQSLEEQLRPFTANIICDSEYQLGEDVHCRFDITNNDKYDYHLLKRYTPLEGMRYNYLTVTQGGRPVYYDGLLIRRAEPTEDEYILVKAGETVSAKVDLSLAYAMHATERYEVKLNAPIQYHKYAQERCVLQSNSEFVDRHDHTTSLESNSVSFRLAGLANPRKTMGEYYRQQSKTSQQVTTEQAGSPRDPKFVGGTTAQRVLFKELHRSMYYYLLAGREDIDDNPNHYIKWFGRRFNRNVRKVKDSFDAMINAMERNFEYEFNSPDCEANYYAFTTIGGTTVFLCDLALSDNVPNILGENSKLCTVVHEFAHATARINEFHDEVYSLQPALNLAVNDPWHAVNNAENYCYFTETLNIFDYGRDSMALWPSGNRRLYVTRGNMYIRYTNGLGSKISKGYPKCIRGNWNNLPERFYGGFDSMLDFGGDLYITKGNQYVCYTCNSKAPQSLNSYGLSKVQGIFSQGFDSAVALGSSKKYRYVTKGSKYINADYPPGGVSSIYSIQGDWGNTPASFNEGFDSMVTLTNGKTYVTKGKEYIRYSDNWAVKIDSGYPRPIRGYWGTITIPGHSDQEEEL